eukprot:evm.model.scf_1232.5 EVM.evm.TU.scf_1232.5   scf_1232:34864-40808(-)
MATRHASRLLSGRLLRAAPPLDSARGLAASPGSLPLAAIKALRERSGAPISDVKQALEETGYDAEKAFEALRKKGLAAASKKATRPASEGLVGVAHSSSGLAIVEVNCETDFVARNKVFGELVSSVASCAAASPLHVQGANCEVDVEAVGQLKAEGQNMTLSDSIKEVAATVRENVKLRRAFLLTSPGVMWSYVHNPSPSGLPGLGQIVGVVSLESADGGPLTDSMKQVLKAQNAGQTLAMHVVGMRPQYIDRSAVDPAHLDREKAFLKEQALASGKPAAIVDKIVAGRLGKFFEEHCLMEQGYILDEGVKVGARLAALAKEGGMAGGLRVGSLLRVQCGEGL